MATCTQRVGAGVVTYACNLEEKHDGPCVAIENQASLARRRAWEAEREAERARAILSEGQGPAQTFHELRGEGPALPHPDLRETEQPGEVTFPQARIDDKGRPVDGMEFVQDFKMMEEITNEVCPGCGYKTTDFNIATLPTVLGPAQVRQCPNCSIIFTPSVFYRMVEPAEPAEPAEPTKQRPGDQVLPTVNNLPYIQDMLIERIEERKAIGIERYGTPLQPFNGRDGLQDAFEESLDQTTYLLQVLYEHKRISKQLREIASTLDQAGFHQISEDLRSIAHTWDPL